MIVAHDVLVSSDNADFDPSDESESGRYTSILFRVGGSDPLNKKTADRSVDMLDLQTGMWSSLPSMRYSRSQSQPALFNGNIVCAGGRNKKSRPMSHVEMFEIEHSRWRELCALTYPRFGHAVTTIYGDDSDKIFVCGMSAQRGSGGILSPHCFVMAIIRWLGPKE